MEDPQERSRSDVLHCPDRNPDGPAAATLIARLAALVLVLAWAMAAPAGAGPRSPMGETSAQDVSGAMLPGPVAQDHKALERFVLQKTPRAERWWPMHAPDAGLPPPDFRLAAHAVGTEPVALVPGCAPTSSCILPDARAPPIRG